MDAERWRRVQDLFHKVCDSGGSYGLVSLREECAGDEALYSEVLAMLRQDGAESVLDRGLPHMAEGALGPSRSAVHKTVGAYEIQAVLGEGGMGTVFLGSRADLGSVAAIKVLRDAWVSPARRERFAAEQRTLAQLDHPNIARLLDAGTLDGGAPYFVMEHVDGVPLDRYCRERGASIAVRLQLFRAVCEAVQFAHRHAVIHRDIKPSNILVKADGAVKLLDFGIAKQVDEYHPGADATRTGLRLMTPAYASPEQVRGESAAVQTDVYSLGVVLYQLLTDRLPFDVSDRTPAEAAELLAERDPVRPSLVARRLRQRRPEGQFVPAAGDSEWADLDVLCLTAMHKDTQKRYSSVEALIRDIGHFLRGEPLEARPDSLGYRLGKFVRRHRGAVAAGVAVLMTIAGLVVYFTARLAAERNSALAEAARTQRIQRFMLDLFQGGDPEAGPARDLRVTTLLDRGVQEARTLDRDPEVQAELYQTLGDIFQKLGSLDEAEGLLKLSLEKRRSLPEAKRSGVADGLVAMGILRADQARLEEAERLVRQGLELNRAALPPEHPSIAAGMDALGRVLQEKGEYAKAIPVLEEAVRLRSPAGGSSAELAASLYELANAKFYSGDYKEAETLNRRVLEMSRRLFGERHPRVAEALVNLGAIQQDLGNYREAERFHRQALEITRAFFGANHNRTAANMIMVARALVFQRKLEEADGLLREAIAVQERTFGPVHPRVASALNELGNVALMRKRFAEARSSFQRMADSYRAIYSGKHYLIGTAVSNVGSVYMAEQDYGRAEAHFREALAMFGQTLAPDHLNAAIARIKLGRTLLRQKRYSEAEAESSAGYSILTKQVSPSVSWLNSARTDLAEIYDAQRQPQRAAALRKEIAAVTATR